MTATSNRTEQIAAFYTRHAARLNHNVATNVHAPDQTIQDACQNAWANLLRREHITLDDGGAV